MNQGVISAKSQLQKLVALSTSEAETIALTELIKDALSLKLLCEELGLRPESELVPIHEDNVSCREQSTMHVPLASNASSTDAEHRTFQEYC